MDRVKLLKTFTNSKEKIEFAKVLDNIYLCKKNHGKVFTHFLDPYKANKFYNIIKNTKFDFDFNFSIFGGAQSSERQMIGFAPNYMELDKIDFPISVILVKYNVRFSKTLTHRDFLGSVLGLGIERYNIGDIILTEEGALIFIFKNMVDYVCSNLEKVSSTKVLAELKDITQIKMPTENKEEKRITVSSLRLDSVISSVFNFSRSKSSQLIESEKVFINWISATSVSKTVTENDIITIRGFGRIIINEILGRTKKDRILLSVYKFN